MWPLGADADPAAQSTNTSQQTKRRASEHSRGTSGPKSGPTSFFFRTEEELEHEETTDQSSTVHDSSYGVQSLASNVSSTCEDDSREIGPIGGFGEQNDTVDSRNVDGDSFGPLSATTAASEAVQQTVSDSASDSSPSRPLPRDVATAALSGRFTPLHIHSPVGDSESGPASTPKSVSLRSLRMSDDGYGADDAASQAITSGDEDEELEADGAADALDAQDALQLVMPNLRLPSRRPFTEKGKSIGKLKILVAGAKGVGKTSLIKSIVRTCDDIVHVDPLTGSALSLSGSDRRSWKQQAPVNEFNDRGSITEVFASTRAYPPWWSELGESRVLRRRQSLGEQVLERNICFVDTPGFEPETPNPSRRTIDSIIAHVEASLQRNLSFPSMADGEVLNILGGSGGVQVDLVLYVLSKEPSAYDLDLIRRLSDFVLVVPVISKADLLSEEELQDLRVSVSNDMRSADISVIDFKNAATGAGSWTSSTARTVWAVSSAHGNDDDNMDASLLMSPDYIQPLVPSELEDLVSHIFDPDKAAWLRHLAARKFLHWRRSNSKLLASTIPAQPPPQASTTAHHPSTPSPNASSSALTSFSAPDTGTGSGVLVSRAPSLQVITTAALRQPHGTAMALSPAPSFTAARLADHTQREESLARARLARWAVDLQRSLQHERERFTTLRLDEQRAWLTQRTAELCPDATTHREKHTRAHGAVVRPSQRQRRDTSEGAAKAVDPADPLGLLEWDERLRRRGLAAVQVLGSAGVFGAVVLLALRRWGLCAGFGFGFGASAGVSAGASAWDPYGAYGREGETPWAWWWVPASAGAPWWLGGSAER